MVMPEGGGCPVGAEQTGIVSIGETFRVVGGSCCSDMSFSSVLAPLAWESARACSNAMKQSSSELGACCCAGFIAEGRTKGGVSWRNLVEQVQAGVGPGSCSG